MKTTSDAGGPWTATAISVEGASHKVTGLPCQDSSAADANDAWAYAIVADGHGSEKYFRSERGSKFATDVLAMAFESAKSLAQADGGSASDSSDIKNWMDWAPQWVQANWLRLVYNDLLIDPPIVVDGPDLEHGLKRLLDKTLSQKGYPTVTKLCSQIVKFAKLASEQKGEIPQGFSLPGENQSVWREEVIGDWQVPAYGSTLLGVFVGPRFALWFQLGDGAMVEVRDGNATFLVPPPEAAIANETPSLCMHDAVRFARVGGFDFGTGMPTALILTSDGIPNSYETTDGFFKFCAEIANLAQTTDDVESKLLGWLPTISKTGSGDDMSIAMIVRSGANASQEIDESVRSIPIARGKKEDAFHSSSNSIFDMLITEIEEANAEDG